MLAKLSQRGEVVPEPARALIAEHQEATGEQSLDHRPQLFVDRLIARSIDAFDYAPKSGTVFYDRGLPDCITYADVYGLDTEPARRAAEQHRYHRSVFVCPPWRDIYTTDDMRRATIEQVEAFHASLVEVYTSLGYELVKVPMTSVEGRAAFIRSTLDLSSAD